MSAKPLCSDWAAVQSSKIDARLLRDFFEGSGFSEDRRRLEGLWTVMSVEKGRMVEQLLQSINEDSVMAVLRTGHPNVQERLMHLKAVNADASTAAL